MTSLPTQSGQEVPEPTSCPDPTHLVIGAEVKGSDVLLVLLGATVSVQGAVRTGCHPHRHLAPTLPALTCSRLRSTAPEAMSKMLTLVPQTQKRCCPVWSSWGQRGLRQGNTLQSQAPHHPADPPPDPPPPSPRRGQYLHLPALVERLDLALDSIAGGETGQESEPPPWSPVPSPVLGALPEVNPIGPCP